MFGVCMFLFFPSKISHNWTIHFRLSIKIVNWDCLNRMKRMNALNHYNKWTNSMATFCICIRIRIHLCVFCRFNCRSMYGTEVKQNWISSWKEQIIEKDNCTYEQLNRLNCIEYEWKAFGFWQSIDCHRHRHHHH